MKSNNSGDGIFAFIQKWIILNADANSPREWRESCKLIMSGFLAMCFWIFLGKMIFFHLETSKQFAQKVIELPSVDKERVSQIEKASLNFDGTIKGIYGLVLPLATAVTTYFFASSGLSSDSRKSEQLNSKDKE